ncbi:TraB family protein [Roseivivax jejudonensis]|uniref:TraB family protein n=1 Tax=Roseivivax jejudonensis TaxID=1529041 RepID=A0A1X6Y9J3_9RHOB|nr:TraB/GumN family protein [Roseivivax jejudonensis]SLN14196.1 TraB family protein [Roseivivax jejudonensis]
MRRLALLATAFSLCLAQGASAECEGRDLRATLDRDERAELTEALADKPYAEGNHWIARRDDTVIHLVGTIHLSDPRLEGPAERLAPVIADARHLLLEATPDGLAELQDRLSTDPGLLVLEDTTLPELMPEAEWQRLAEAMRARGIPAVLAAKFQPWYLAMLLAVPACAASALGENAGLDMRLQEVAETAGTPMQALEGIETVFEAFADASLEDQVELLRASLIDTDVSGDMFVTLLATYFDEKTGESWELNRILARRASPASAEELDAMYAEMERTLLIDRNHAWMPVILDAAGPSGPIVVAAGAAHLQGEHGLAALLAKDGFSLSRAPF